VGVFVNDGPHLGVRHRTANKRQAKWRKAEVYTKIERCRNQVRGFESLPGSLRQQSMPYDCVLNKMDLLTLVLEAMQS
jgi:hypothetical protein